MDSPAEHPVRSSPTPAATTARVADLMQCSIVTISAGDRLATLDDIMTLGGVRHVPVVRGGELVGVVSQRDLLRASLSSLSEFAPDHRRAFLQGIDVARVMSSPAVAVTPDTDVRQAAELMAEGEIGCLPVLRSDGALAGMVTETDLLRFLAERTGSRGGGGSEGDEMPAGGGSAAPSRFV